MRIRMLSVILLAGFVSLTATAGFEQFNDPIGGMWVTPLNGDPAFGIYPFGLSELQAITSDNRTFEFKPNVNLYADNPTNSVWRNNGGAGPDGNSTLIASTVYEIGSITPDLTSAVFEFNVDAYDLNNRYSMVAYIKVLDPNNGYSVTATTGNISINRFGLFQLQLSLSASYEGQVLQAGWDLTGLNANPADDWGSATITASNLYAVSSDNVAPVPNPMTFAVEPYAVSSNSISMTASNAADDIYDVEYLFTNTVNNTSSGWQSSPTWVDNGPATGSPTTNVVDKIIDPTFLNINANWSGYAGGSQTPSSFVSVSGGVATITPGSTAEWAFYQEFNGVLNAGQTYEFSIASDNSTLVGASAVVAFIKAFGPGYVWKGAEYKSVPLPLNGSVTNITFTAQPGTTIYQIGVFVTGATSGSYDVSGPSLTTTEIIPFVTGLTPDTEYTYMVKARDTSPNLNETAWSSPASATSTVTDVTAPTPNPMTFAVAPVAISDTAISMTASTATDDAFGVEYLFTNTVNGTSSGWISSPEWTDSSDLLILNADFEAGGTNWNFNSGGVDPAGAGVTNISGNTAALIYVEGTGGNGAWAVAVQAITNIAGKNFSGGDAVTVSVDIRALAGLNGGGAGIKMESWGGGSFISGSGDMFFSVTESFATYTTNYTIAAAADEVRIVLLTVAGYGGATATDSYYLFDNVTVTKPGGLSSGTQYTYMVKARDTSGNANETAWSSPASATTTGVGPITPFDVQIAGITPGGTVFTWQGTSGYIYEVQYKTNLVTDIEWMTDPSPGASGIFSDGGSISATSTVDSASAFYRIIAQ